MCASRASRFSTSSIQLTRGADPDVFFAGEAPVGISGVRGGARGGGREADRDVPRLRRHAVAHRQGPRQRRHDRRGQEQFVFFSLVSNVFVLAEGEAEHALFRRTFCLGSAVPAANHVVVPCPDEGGSERRGREFPDGDRQRQVHRQGAFQLQLFLFLRSLPFWLLPFLSAFLQTAIFYLPSPWIAWCCEPRRV